jgi:DNA recombination protein RmuC
MIFFLLFLLLVGVVFLLYQSQRAIKESFKSLSLDVLERSNRSFLQLAGSVFEKYQESAKGELEKKEKEIASMILPLKESLARLDEQQLRLERQREGAHATLSSQLNALLQSEANLRKEASDLAKALKSPNVRGSWGQLHLKRVVELAGLTSHADFTEQQTVFSQEGVLRPDLVIHLPQEREIIIDAKTPLDAYHEAMLCVDEKSRKEKLLLHVQQIKKQIKDLSSKEYWKAFSSSPDWVILFLPSESFFSAAVEIDNSLIEEGARHNVMIATPTTLIAILRAVSFAWKQDSLSKSAKEIAQLGSELYERLFSMNGHFMKLGKSLSSSIESYNLAMSSMESRVLVSARKLKEMGVASGGKELASHISVENEPRE